MNTSLVLCVLALVLGYCSANTSPCPDGWRYSPFTSKCYKLFEDKTSWTTAEYKCAFQGAHHISVHDAADNQFVSELARQANIVWLGAVQYGTDRDYTWADHTAYGAFENWENGRRPSYHKGKKCSKFDGLSGKWIQSCCKVPAAFICSKPAAVLPAAIIEDDTGINEDFRRTRLAFRRRV
ncbi:unnamed protein product [Bursaphelenchus xylophilus]|uniref:(pine wood nematode) hypothetical protein n=1 Tax=Bursaphelenchus xylophilus TaxID=6326 RepID=A0A1I7RSZ4_BURXY|nr:clec [Bursaphelenchus xylophilus]CAD5231498.1 unnamed protein product [Bursaphelenchus xylophilus]CAG9122718.1 unnamed protein product [Bursaphelenchus xylophilus]